LSIKIDLGIRVGTVGTPRRVV